MCKSGKNHAGKPKQEQHMNLVLLHYFGGSPDSWNPLFDVMEKRGLGNVSFTPLALNSFMLDNYSVTGIAAEIENFVESNVQEEYVLVGHSMGGKISLVMASLGSEKLRGVVLLAPSPPTPEPFDEAIREQMLTMERTRVAAEETIRSVSFQPLLPPVMEQAIQDNLHTNQMLWKDWLETGTREDVTAVLPKVKVPVLVVAGQHDQNMTPDLLQREIAEKIPGAQLKVVDTGHLVPMEAPETTATLIGEFLRGL
jgi:pimeloyl-ACP methyl ester carboxylesterase